MKFNMESNKLMLLVINRFVSYIQKTIHDKYQINTLAERIMFYKANVDQTKF